MLFFLLSNNIKAVRKGSVTSSKPCLIQLDFFVGEFSTRPEYPKVLAMLWAGHKLMSRLLSKI